MAESKIRAKKLTKEEWEEIEIDVSENEKKVCLCMLNLGETEKNDTVESKMTVLGEELYQEHFHALILKIYCKNDKISSPTKKMKNDETKKKLNPKKKKNDVYSKHLAVEKDRKLKEMAADLPNWNIDNLFNQKNVGFNSKILEIKLLSFLQVKRIQPEDEINLFEIIMALKKCLFYYSSYQGISENDQNKDMVSETCIALLTEFLNKLIKQVGFSIKKVFLENPKFIFYTKYDDYFEVLNIKPFESQNEILNNFKVHLYNQQNAGALFFYRPAIGSGKTTVCLAILTAIMEYNKTHTTPKPRNYGLIFCCGVTQVRIQMGQMAYAALKFKKITFAVAAIDHTDKLRIVNHFSCQNEENPDLIIADMETTSRILRQKARSFILFMDDPIIDADQRKSPITENFVHIMKIAPPMTIISSATLPTPESVPCLIRLFRNGNTNANIETISSDRAKIGQQVYCDFNHKYYPHLNCKDRTSLKNVIKAIKSSPFLARMYTGSSLYQLETIFLRILKLESSESRIEKYFLNPSTWNQEAIENFVINLLESLLNTDNQTIKEFCSPSNYLIEDDYFRISFEQLAKKDAYKLSGGCLIASENPSSFAREWFGSWIKKCDLNDMVQEYKRKVIEFEGGKKKFNDIKNEIEALKQLESYKNMCIIKFKFPENLKINTKIHCETYGAEAHNLVYRKDEEAQNLIISDLEKDINLMLMAGIGIFDEASIDNPEYQKTIRRKAKANQLAYLISKTDILYGANFPLNNIIIEKDFSIKYSISTIFQIMGRAGRMGSSWKSNCFIFEDLQNKLDSYVKTKAARECDSKKEAFKIEEIVTRMIGNPSPIDESINKVTIYFNKKKLDAVFAFIPCFWYYCLKLKKECKSLILSDFDISEYIRTPSYKLNALDFSPPLKNETIIFLDTFSESIVSFIKNYHEIFKKLIIINHQETTVKKLLKLKLDPKIIEKIEIIYKFRTSSAKLSFGKYIPLIQTEFKLKEIENTIPDVIKNKSEKRFDLDQFEKIVDLIDDHHISFGKIKKESRWIGSFIIEKLKNGDCFFSIDLRKIWNLMILDLYELDKKGKEKFENIVKVFEPLIEKDLNIVTILNEKKEKINVFLFKNLPIEHFIHKSTFCHLILEKFDKYKNKISNLQRVVILCKIKNEIAKLTLRSEENEFSTEKFCEKYQGGGHSYASGCEVPIEQFGKWKFTPIK